VRRPEHDQWVEYKLDGYGGIEMLPQRTDQELEGKRLAWPEYYIHVTEALLKKQRELTARWSISQLTLQSWSFACGSHMMMDRRHAEL
jgi:hypothetical protein